MVLPPRTMSPFVNVKSMIKYTQFLAYANTPYTSIPSFLPLFATDYTYLVCDIWPGIAVAEPETVIKTKGKVRSASISRSDKWCPGAH